MVSSGKTFQEVVEYVKSIEGVKQEVYTRSVEKKARRVGSFSGAFVGARAQHSFSGSSIQSAM